MKKLLSILLSVIMAMSVIIIPTSVSAKKAKTVPNTYVPSDMDETGVIGVNVPNKGIVYKETYKLVLKKTNGKLVTLDKYNRTSNSVSTYYIRGNSVYYGYRDKAKKNYKSQIRKVDLDGKNKTTLYSKIYANGDAFYLIGGYGSGVIFSEKIYNKKNKTYTYIVKMIRNKKVTTLFKVNSKKKVDFKIFSGKVFYNNKSYDLAKGKSTSYVAKRIYITKNYMYYINKNNNLKSLDKKDVRRIVTKNVYKYYNANHSNDVVYSKLNKNKEEVFYQKTGTNKEIRLCSENDIKNLVGKSDKNMFVVGTAILHKNKVYFTTSEGKADKTYGVLVLPDYNVKYSHIVTVDIKGGTPKIYYKAPYSYEINTYIFNNTFKYNLYDPFDTDIIDD